MNSKPPLNATDKRGVTNRPRASREATLSAPAPVSKATSRRLDIGEKAQKLLWSRAAGRCSKPGCRIVLTLDRLDGDSATLGEMAHIIGYEPRSARSDSPLTEAERNQYSNLILLCRNHHAEVDADEKAFPVEVLHGYKVAHEEWVATSLSASPADPDLMVHADLVDTITTSLQLDQWPWFIDNAVRDLVHNDFVDARGTLNSRLLATLWPSARPKLTTAAKNVITAFDDYMGNFLSRAELRGNNYLAADKSYKRYVNANYDRDAAAEDRWSQRNFTLLCQYVVRLNKFADAVRSTLNPMYHRLAGRFLVIDSLGYRLREPGIFDPTEPYVRRLLRDTA